MAGGHGADDRLDTALRVCAIMLVMLLFWLTYRAMADAGLLARLFDSAALQRAASGLGPYGPLLIVGLMALAIVLNPIPSAPIALVSGALYGHGWGTLYVIAGAESGALIAFGIARLLGQELVERWLGDRVRLGWLGSQNILTWTVLVSRLLPFVSFDLVSYGAGLTIIRWWRFALATLLGLIPASFLLAHLGGKFSAADLDGVMALVLLLGLLVLLPLLYRLVRQAGNRKGESGGID